MALIAWDENKTWEDDEVDHSLIRVTKNLYELREKLVGDLDGKEIELLDMTIQAAEKSLHRNNERRVTASNQTVTTLPYLEASVKKTGPPRTKRSVSQKAGKPNDLMQQLLQNPLHPRSRQIVTKKYKLPAVTERGRGPHEVPGSLVRGLTLREPSLDPQNAVKSGGIINLFQKHVIPQHADISLVPAPVQRVKPTEKHLRWEEDQIISKPQPQKTQLKLFTPALPSPPPVSPAPTSLSSGFYRIAFQRGKLRPDEHFDHFKSQNRGSWGSLVTCLEAFEKLLGLFNVPLAFVDSRELVSLADQTCSPSRAQLIECLVDKEHVAGLMKLPDQKFKGSDRRERAAIVIQACARMFLARSRYLDWRRAKFRSAVCVMRWLTQCRLSRVRRMLRQTRADQLSRVGQLNATLRANWPRICAGRRLEVHLPSLGAPQHIRDSLDLAPLQNSQIGRLATQHADIIYVSPVKMTKDQWRYLNKLLGREIKVIEPEALTRFTTHAMSLSTRLKYSPRALKRLRALVKGRDAYLVPWVVSQDDITVADYLGIPILGTEPHLAEMYAQQSGVSRCLDATSGVDRPPSVTDIFNLDQLKEALASLIVEHPRISVWLLKIDDQIFGRGNAWLDISNTLDCLPLLRKEATSFGQKWNTARWNLETWTGRVASQMEESVLAGIRFSAACSYRSLAAFVDAMTHHGVTIQAYPPSDEVTNLSVDVLIAPDGSLEVVCSGDQLHGGPSEASGSTPAGRLATEAGRFLSVWGSTLPSTACDPSIVNKQALEVARACAERGVVGHMQVDFATFLEADSDHQIVWCTGLKLGFSTQLAGARLGMLLARARFEPASHRVLSDGQDRFIVCSGPLTHTNMKLVHYSVFFKMCRAHGLGFDTRARLGTVFLMSPDHTSARDTFGMITVGANLTDALVGLSKNLHIVHGEISGRGMQGKSNFDSVTREIEQILNISLTNCSSRETNTPL